MLGRGRVVDSLTPSDFGKLRDAKSAEVAISTLQPFVGRVRHVFTWGNENEICEQPKFGRMFDAPTQRALKKHHQKQGQQTFTREEILEILKTAKPQLRAMVLLGINAGYNPSDVAYLEFRYIQDEWLRDFPRVKTGEDRKAWLWPETLSAIGEYLAIRHEPTDEQFSDRVFTTNRGTPFGNSRDANDIGALLRRHLRTIDMYQHRVSFKMLRDTFATEADQTGDMRAVKVVMGHTQGDMTGRYVKRFDDDRVKRVCEHVRTWLFGGADE